MDKEKAIKFGLAGLAIVAGGLLASFIIKSIVALTVLVVGGLALINGAPLLAHWAAQMKIKGFLFLAAKNPVEELVKQYEDKHNRLVEAGQAIAAFGRETKNYGDQVKEFARRRPEKAADFQATYDKMAFVYQKRLDALQRSTVELKKFEAVIEEARDIWAMTQAALKANRLLSKFTNADPMEEIRQKTALNSVYGSLNQVMTELDTAMAMDYEALAAPTQAQLSQAKPIDASLFAGGGFENLFDQHQPIVGQKQPVALAQR